MIQINYTSISQIFFSCTEKEHIGVENTVPEHALIYIYSGSMSIVEADRTYVIHEGDSVLLPRNLLARFVKHPSATSDFRSVSVLFSQPFLQIHYSRHPVRIKSKWDIHPLNRHPLLTSLFNSILPYYELHGNLLPEHLIEMKLGEAIVILQEIDKEVDHLLANFSECGKIDLADFMQKNYSFNIPLERFAYLTGRSLATFKRDFRKVFNTSPQKWLLETRLNRAHYLISKKSKKLSEVYSEVGFQNFSHFSDSFKQYFGYTPSSVAVSC